MKKYNIINNILGWCCFVVAAVTYLLTIEPTASFWDCPEFISQGAKLEVGHPPGNPIFMLAARFFVTLFGNSMANAAVAVNSMSALLSAGTILLLFWTITHLIRRLIVRDDATEIAPWKMFLIFAGGVCGSLAYTWSDTFWFSAVEGEVYAFSSFCTALVFWLILKWENRADRPHSDRYLILIAYVIGVSIAVHLLNLLCIPAIVLVYYYRKYKNVNAKGSLIALAISFVIVALILFGLVPGFVKVAQWFEIFFVNGLGMHYNMGVLFYTIFLVAAFIWAIVELNKPRKSPGAIKFSFSLAITLSGMLFIGNWFIGLLLVAALLVYVYGFCKQIPVRVFNVITLSVFLIFVGYSSYALLLIRSNANTPMNQNAPDNVFTLGSYLNREQYGETPLLYGATFGEELAIQNVGSEDQPYYVVAVDRSGIPQTRILDGVLRDENGAPYSDPKMTYRKVVKTSDKQADKYVETVSNPNYGEIPGLKMLLPRIYSNNPAHVSGYKGWSGYSIEDLRNIPAEVRSRWAAAGYAPLTEIAPYLHSQEKVATAIDHSGNPVEQTGVWKPGYLDILSYFFNYQFAHMYWRYFMWNFAGRQNDLAGNGEPHLGNWISGIPFIDNARLGDQSLLPDEYGAGNKGHNVFYMLPLLLGVIGLLFQALYVKPDRPQRGIEQFWVVFFLFFMTGVAIILYLNQTPGQPRERDYAFAGSFYAFAIWIGLGIPALGMMLRSALAKAKKVAVDKIDSLDRSAAAWAIAAVVGIIAIGVPLQMVSQTWDDHDRSGRYTTRDLGMNYLSSLEPNAIIFCNGDNDTFPLWYAQEVEGYRTDVRVVNFSYLTTDWYANQQRIPSYDGAPIKMYATPADYGNDRMSYAFVVPRVDSVVNAKDALLDLYQSPAVYKQPVMTMTKVVMPVDSAAVVKRFGLNPANPADAKYALPYISSPRTDLYEFLQSTGKGGLNLGNTLGLDFTANSVEGNFERPVYFAATVPSSYYLGLSPYMYSTGMASMVAPFAGTEVSPLVDKAYENIVGKFRWGGLDGDNPAGLYLDETVRRMVSSTRSSVFGVARDLINSGDMPASAWAVAHSAEYGFATPRTRYDMARNLLDLILVKTPESAALLDANMVIYMAQSYYDLYVDAHNKADLDHARQLAESAVKRFAPFVRYASSLSYSQQSLLNYDIDLARYLVDAIALLNRIEVLTALEKNPEANAEILAAWATRTNVSNQPEVGDLSYLKGASAAELRRELPTYDGIAHQLVQSAIDNLDAHAAAGVDPMKLTNAIVQQYHLDIPAWMNLLR